MEQIVTLFVLHGFILGGFCTFVAGEKHRDQFAWAILGFFFGVVALLAVVGVPRLEKSAATEIADSQSSFQPGDSDAGTKKKAYITPDGNGWFCSCGASNSYKPELAIQNCCHCKANRDFVLAG
ncbi:hypothetical protein [Pseudohongiella acticola]|uniref:hypothetical protein n=1 Tax=Pseudohongiella acticola TaxID=1524254 RepID=UPI0030ECFBC8